jgi:diguanylate cyclase (GGDEF)-like protein
MAVRQVSRGPMQGIPSRDEVDRAVTNPDAVEENSARELAIVEEFATAAASASELEELLRLALESVKTATNCASCYCLLPQEGQENRQEQILYYLSGDRVVARESPTSSSVVQEVSESGRAVSVPATSAAARELDLETGLKAFFLTPMRSKGRAVGTMILGSTADLGFTRRQVTMANIVASQLAIALENIQLNRRVQESSGVDPVTGLASRPQFVGCLQYEVARATRYRRWLSLAIVEIDGLGDFRSRYGGPAAEAALCDVATIIQRHARSTDFAARCGEDQFAAVLPETDAAGAKVYAERVRRSIGELPIVPPASRGEIRLTVSVGVTSYQASLKGGLSPDAIMSKADQALYLAKRDGGNRVCEAG